MLDVCFFFFFKHKTAYEMRISDWSSDVCSSDLRHFTRSSRSEIAVTATTPVLQQPRQQQTENDATAQQTRTGDQRCALGTLTIETLRGRRHRLLLGGKLGFQPDRKSTRLNSSH